jgi:hypothetical protein
MTLILTELSPFGIAMAADSALVQDLRKPNGTIGEKVYHGALKLFSVSKLRAGIAYWGWGDIPEPGQDWFSKSLVRTELWLPSFLGTNEEKYNSISELAQLLEGELRKRIPKIDVTEQPDGDGGIHLAGYELKDGQLFPTLWHIHNGKSQRLPKKILDPTIVNANNDITPEEGYDIVQKQGLVILRNGDIKPYTILWELLFKPKSPFAEIVASTGLTFPYANNLSERTKFLSFQIQTVTGIYRFSKEDRGIGGPITTLSIDQNGMKTLQ